MSENVNKDTINEKEFDAAVAAAKVAKGTYTHVFAKPFTYKNEEINQLHFDFESLTGRDYLNIEAEVRMIDGLNALVASMCTPFMMSMAAKACGKGRDIFDNMPLKDMSRIRTAARDFLLSSEL